MNGLTATSHLGFSVYLIFQANRKREKGGSGMKSLKTYLRKALRMSQIKNLRAFPSFLLVLCLVTSAAAQHASEQIIFSNSDNPNPGSSTTGTFNYTAANPEDKFFGFWVWCEGESTNPYAGECRGAMYFYGIALTKGVSGIVTEVSENIYQMTVSSKDGKVACTLTNQSSTITSGLTNTVNAVCSAPSGTGTSPHTVVLVTGP